MFSSRAFILVSSLCFNIGIKHGFSCINILQVPREVLKTEAGRDFQYLPRDLANVYALKNHDIQSLLCIATENICNTSRYFLHYFVLHFHRCLANAISTDYAYSKARQYTFRNGSKSVAPVRSYWKLRSRALTARELSCQYTAFSPVNAWLLITCDTAFYAIIRYKRFNFRCLIGRIRSMYTSRKIILYFIYIWN